MKDHHKNRSVHCRRRGVAGALLAALSLLSAAPAIAAGSTVSGASDTIFRAAPSTVSDDTFALIENLRLSVLSPLQDGSAAALHIAGWGRTELAGKLRDEGPHGDLLYGYLSYLGARNNLIINAGRQFVTEGVAAQHLDGLYLHSDLAAGFAASAYAGAAVVTEPSAKGDDLVFGGRVTHSDHKHYTVGVSALQSLSGGERYREEEAIDLWLHPTGRLDVTGRSSYNSITRGWMEHAYTASFAPVDKVRLFADLSGVNYRDYYYKTTSSVFIFNPLTNGIDPDERLLTLGAGVSYLLHSDLDLAAEYRRYDYDVAGGANYYGARLSYALPDSFSAGLSLHRMGGSLDRLKYTEYRLYAAKKLGKADLTLDLIDVNYHSSAGMNGVKNAVTVVAAGSYQLLKSARLGASLDYSRNPSFDNEVRGLVKLTCLFDLSRPAKGETTSEK